jgi:hypothetical protein
VSHHEFLAECEKRELSRSKVRGQSDLVALFAVVLKEGLFDEIDSLSILRASYGRLASTSRLYADYLRRDKCVLALSPVARPSVN